MQGLFNFKNQASRKKTTTSTTTTKKQKKNTKTKTHISSLNIKNLCNNHVCIHDHDIYKSNHLSKVNIFQILSALQLKYKLYKVE